MEKLRNEKIELEISEVGATITSLKYNGILIMTKGYTVGRYANRIKNASFMLNGIRYNLTKNEGENILHGGKCGFMKKTWFLEDKTDSSITFSYFSEDLEEGFPGNMKVFVTFRLLDSKLEISYKASSDKDTVINLTNHGYFNLNGGGSIYDHDIMISSDKVLDVDSELIPTKIISVNNTKFDLRELKPLSTNFDHNFILSGSGFRKVASLVGIRSKIKMNVYTDQVGMQVYNTDSEICFETQHYPDSPNHMEYPSTILRAFETFKSRTIYEFVDYDTI